MRVTLFAARVLGKRTFLLFGFFTFLCVAVIGATYVTSRYALKVYVEDQLSRISWDVALYQSRAIPKAPEFLETLRQLPQVTQAESLVFLRARLPEGLKVEAGGAAVVVPWYVVLSSTSPELLPPAYRAVGGKTTLSLFGSRDLVQANLTRIRSADDFAFLGRTVQEHEHQDGQQHPHAGDWRALFSVPVNQVVELDREELNRWLLEKTGSISFVPYLGAGLHMPYDPALFAQLDRLFQAHTHEHGEIDIHEESGDYLPEIDHMVMLDRDKLISGWDLEGSYQRVEQVLEVIREVIPLTYNIQLRSDTLLLIERMSEISKLIGIVTLFLALPVIVIAWVFAANLVHFVILTERRTIGLMRLRGLRGSLLSRVFLLTILTSGAMGGLLGLAAGMILPLVAYEDLGSVMRLVSLQEPFLALLFLMVGLSVSLLIGLRLIKLVRRLTPREASSRFASSGAATVGLRFGFFTALALFVGGGTALAWVTGFSVAERFPELRQFERLLDLLALPLLIYGLAVLLASRRTVIAACIRLLAPLSRGRLSSFAVEQAVRRPGRVAGVVLVGSLAAAITLAPSIASHSFTQKGVRGVKVQLGANANLTFNTVSLGEDPEENLGDRIASIRRWIQPSLEALGEQSEISSTELVVRSLIRLYVPGYGYGGTPLFLIQDPETYLKHVYHEEELGLDGAFREIILQLKEGKVAVSPSVAEFWSLSAGDEVLVGFDDQGRPVKAPVAGTLAMLPGAPLRSVEDRDSFATAHADYLSHLFRSEAFLVASMESPFVDSISALVPQVTTIVETTGESSLPTVELPIHPRDERFFSQEVTKVRKDMFIHLVGENFKIYLVAGLLIALFAVTATFVVNFTEDRRMLALLRVRGASPWDLMGALVVQLYSPLFLSLILGCVIGGLAGLGISHRVWDLQRVPTIMNLLRTELVFSWESVLVILFIMAVLAALVSLLGMWTFQKTAREAIRQE